VRLDLKTVKTILGYQRRPRYRKWKKHSANWEVAVERPTYDLTIFKRHRGKLNLKIYTKGERVLRIEAVAPQYPGTRLWTLAGEVSGDRYTFEEHSGADYDCAVVRRSALHRR
jgi:hypothetical protein